MTTSSTDAHVLIFPFPAQGHMIPLLDLAHQLATRGLNITILVTPKNLPLLNPLLSAQPSIKTLVLPFPTHPSIPPGVENLKDLPPSSFASMMLPLGELRGPLIRWFRSHPSPPVAIISDIFLGWTHGVACELGLHRVVFSPSGAMALSVMCSLWQDLPKRANPDDQNEVISFPSIPGSLEYPWWQISPLYRRYADGDPDMEFFKDGFRANVASWGLVINSFSELERPYLEHLRKQMGHDRVWAVGPLLPPDDGGHAGPKERGGSSSVSEEEILSFLERGDRKVVYACFGSQALLPKHLMDELALGLEKSGVHFIWSIKEPTNEQVVDGRIYGRTPSGFEDRVAGRGLVIRGWAPQVLILRHRAVGAFLTHCGWNSVLEGIVAGVPMLAWPVGADQFVNAGLVVDELQVATRVGEGAQTVPNSDDLARLLAELICENRVESKRAADLREAALEAIKIEGGSSAKEFDSMVSSLAALTLTANGV